MLGGVNSASTSIASVYNQSSNELAQTQAKIASGKRFQSASDDFTAYFRTAALKSEVDAYDVIRQDLSQQKGAADLAKKVGNQLLDDITELQKVNESFKAATGDAATALSAQFDVLAAAIEDTVSSTSFDGTVIADGTYTVTATSNADGGTISVALDGDMTGITGLTAGAGSDAAITTALTGASTYVAQAAGAGKAIDNAIALATTVMDSKNAAISAVSGIDDAAELAKATDLQIRQTAAISMLSQANTSRQGIMRLYL